MSRSRWIAFGLVAAILWAVECVPLVVGIGDGTFELTVNVNCPNGFPKSISYEPFGRRATAERLLPEVFRNENGKCEHVIDPYDGQPLKVLVPCGDRFSPLGRVIERDQFECLVVVAVMSGGSRVGVIVDIPDRQVTRTITVTLPAR